MTASHDALRRDLDQLLDATTSPISARARWGTFHRQRRRHVAAEHAAMWPRVRSELAGDSHGQALLDVLDNERQLFGPLQAPRPLGRWC